MATVTKIFCDRCGKEIKYIGWTSKLLNVFKSKSNNQIKIRQRYNGNHSGFGYKETNYELCAECTEKFKEFIREKTGKEGNDEQ